MSSERRKFTRISNSFNVRIAVSTDSSDYRDIKIDVAKSINVSGSGILISVKENIPAGSKIRITFLKPNTFEFFEGFGRVARNESSGDSAYMLGIDFINLTEPEKEKLDYYINLCSDGL